MPSARALDASAVGLSLLCLAHCLALPLLAAVAPAVAVLAHAEWAHAALLALAAPTTVLALYASGHGRPPSRLAALAGAGLTLLALGALAHGREALEVGLTTAGALTLAAAHVWNARRREVERSR